MKGLTDIPGVRVGHASDYEGITGCTVIRCDGGAVAGVDARGSATGTIEFGLLDPSHLTERIHAVVLAGGSAFGLEASSGVRRFLEQKGIGYDMGIARVPLVPGAILFDLGIGKASARPTREMGEAAAGSATDGAVAEGSVGAGTGATIGKLFGMDQAMKGGLGSFTVPLEGPLAGVLVSALVAVNAFGDVRDVRTGELIAGVRESPSNRKLADTARLLRQGSRAQLQRQNTTLAVVATNARLSKVGAAKMAQLGNAGLARVISPAHTTYDGDVTIGLSLGDAVADVNSLGVAAAAALAEATLRAVRLAKSLGGVPGLAG